jgi:hypothetical protein
LRRFDSIRLTAVMAAAAAVLNGCDQNESGAWQASTATRVCVDDAGRRVEDDRCDRGVGGHGGGFVYVRAGRTVPKVGSAVDGGSSAPEAGVVYSDAAHSFAVARGGFGGTGGGEGGGHGGGGE